jgi:CubicO group peptidase (beta-lactamase class C family)
MRRRHQFLACILAVLPLTAASLPSGKPEQVGLSPEALQRIHETIRRHMDSHEMSGAVTLVARKGRIAYLEADGLMDLESGTPMRKDGLFWIASMSKPVTTVAVLMLAEEGKVRLSDPVSRFIPEFRGMRVAVPEEPGAGFVATGAEGLPPFHTVPADREITIQDLLTHVSGLVSGGAVSEAQKEQIDNEQGGTLAEYIPRLADTALDFQPGSRWSYSSVAAFETLGRIIEIASGQRLDAFLQQRIFEPLDMKDTGFQPPAGQIARLAAMYTSEADGLIRIDEGTDWDDEMPYLSGSGGLISDAEDYARFGQMLLNKGELDGKRLLSAKTVDMMTSVFVPDSVPGLPKGISFGLGVKVVTNPDAAGSRVRKGSFGWYGYYGTYFWVDPQEQLLAVLLIQTEGENPRLERDFEDAVEAAVVE